MANYKQGYFVMPVVETDKSVRIKDKFGNIRVSIDPLLVTIMFVKLNVINVRVSSSSNVILMDFASVDEAKKALVELRTEMDKILHRVTKTAVAETTLINQLSTGSDYMSIYETGTASATASNMTMDQRLTQFITKLSSDFSNLKNQETISISLNVSQFYSEDLNEYIDILDVDFLIPSDGKVNIFINGVYLMLGGTNEDVAYMSMDGGVTCQDYITNGCRLYINPFLLGYDLDTYDVITISYLDKLV